MDRSSRTLCPPDRPDTCWSPGCLTMRACQPPCPSSSRVDRAPAPRTLVDIFRETVDAAPRRAGARQRRRGAHLRRARRGGRRGRGRAERASASARATGSGVRIKSGTTDLYVAILGILLAGAAYVPVDADDPDERARLGLRRGRRRRRSIGNDLAIDAAVTRRDGRRQPRPTHRAADVDDDAWVIFTSGSTGTPKGVAVTHRNAAAFVDAESRLFLQDEPLGPGDRVMAGLSVAFDASCEEMWLAWAYGACLVPAPRSLVRSGMDLGPWLVANDITVVSTVPTLVALWPPEALAEVRLLILGGEACPPELGARLPRRAARSGTPTARPRPPSSPAAPLLDGTARSGSGCRSTAGTSPSSTPTGSPVAAGRDRRADHRRRRPGPLPRPGQGRREVRRRCRRWAGTAPTAAATWSRNDPAGLVFVGRADDQVKLGGRRIELGEIDERAARAARRGRRRRRRAAHQSRATSCWSATSPSTRRFDADRRHGAAARTAARRAGPAARRRRRRCRPAPRGKIDRDALPWPLPGDRRTGEPSASTRHRRPGSPSIWLDVLGADVTSAERRLLRPRRRQPDRGPAGRPAAGALPRGRRSPTSTSTPPSATLADRARRAGRRQRGQQTATVPPDRR